jgi:tRNA(Ile)-lysidine synthase
VPTRLPEHVKRTAGCWLGRGLGTPWVVAVSGGSDSVGLLRALHAIAPELGLTLSVAHLNHHARGSESESDAAFVAELAESLGLPFDLGHWRSTRPGHFEADARSARHAFFIETATSRKANAVALGHTRDDQAETVLHRIVRGTGIHGLAGIPSRRVLAPGIVVVRPLLDRTRDEIREYLATIGQPFRDDASNAELSRTRARIRHDLLPGLAADYNPNVAEALVRLARNAAGSSRAVRRLVRETARAAALPGEVAFAREALANAPRFLRAEVIRLAWRCEGWPEADMNATRWERLARIAVRTKPSKFDVGAEVVATTDGVVFTLRYLPNAKKRTPLEPAPLSIPGVVEWPGGRVVLTFDPEAPGDETIDFGKVSPPLVVRAPEPGDRFEPLGMGGKSTALNDFFRGRRIPRAERETTPLVCDAQGIIWVVGHRIAERVKVRETTEVRAVLGWEPQRDRPT